MKNPRLIREVRGVMTRFDPLTEEIVSERSEDGLTYAELADTLSAHGLDIHKVVYDPTRHIFNCFYADYDHGLYATLQLTRSYIHGTGREELRALAKQGGFCRALVDQDWDTYYLRHVPLAMQIYDFSRRYPDLPQDQVFDVWYKIHKRIDYSNDMWPAELLDNVFQCAPATPLPESDADGLITIYRGMGEQSLPPERAISWSSHPGNALWFANRSGRGTHIAVARLRPEQITAYFPTYSAENEVLVRPGTISDYRYEDMIPAIEETIPQMLAPVLPAFLKCGRQARALGYQKEKVFQLHGLQHILRVLLLSLFYIHHSGDELADADRRILIYFSLLHDIGRTNEDTDDEHGRKSVERIRTQGIHLRGIHLTQKQSRIAKLIIVHHYHDDVVGETAIMAAPFLTQGEKEHAFHLYHICKDMDGLDRVRFNGLDYRMLRTEYARRLPLVAGCLLEEKLVEALDMQLPK